MSIHETIKSQIALCKQTGNMFILPEKINAEVERNDLPNEGAHLVHKEYKIYLTNGDWFHIDYHSKDKCHSFQINPDRSTISVKSSVSDLDFSISWDENN